MRATARASHRSTISSHRHAAAYHRSPRRGAADDLAQRPAVPRASAA